jgi:IS5 family transposase
LGVPVYDPYFQHFTGEEFFQHEFPHERSDLSHWRKRLGDKLELLLAESLRVAHASGALRTKDLARVTVDTTLQPKNISFPTDAKLLHAAIKGLNRMAKKHGCGCGNPCASQEPHPGRRMRFLVGTGPCLGIRSETIR